MEIKEILKKRRLELQLTLLDVAKAVGVSEATVSRWESGHIENMRRDKIAQLAKVLKISPSVIMGWEEEPSVVQQEELWQKIKNNTLTHSVIIGQGGKSGQTVRELSENEYEKVLQILDIIEKKS